MRTRSIALAVTLLGLLGGVVSAVHQFLPVIVDRNPASIGLLMATTSLVSFTLSPVGLFVVGYWAAGRSDVPTEFAALAGVFGIVGGVTTFVGYVPVVVAVGPATGFEPTFVATALYTGVVRGVDYALTGLAGASVAYFRNR